MEVMGKLAEVVEQVGPLSLDYHLEFESSSRLRITNQYTGLHRGLFRSSDRDHPPYDTEFDIAVNTQYLPSTSSTTTPSIPIRLTPSLTTLPPTNTQPLPTPLHLRNRLPPRPHSRPIGFPRPPTPAAPTTRLKRRYLHDLLPPKTNREAPNRAIPHF